MKKKLWILFVVALAIGTVGAREIGQRTMRNVETRSADGDRSSKSDKLARPISTCPELSGRVVTLICPSDAVGCAGLGSYGGTPFLVTAPEGTRRVTDTICTEPGNNSYTVNATPGNVQCFPESGDSRVVVFRCAGVLLLLY